MLGQRLVPWILWFRLGLLPNVGLWLVPGLHWFLLGLSRLAPRSLILLFPWISEVLWPILCVSWLHPRVALLHGPLAFLLSNPRISLRSRPLIFFLLAPIIAPRVSLLFFYPGIGLWFAPGCLLLFPIIIILWVATPRLCWCLISVPWVVLRLSPRVLELQLLLLRT